jgi:NAD(P)-dependent dehydrogenase (short-subunit alcohol dehydrogenase family)
VVKGGRLAGKVALMTGGAGSIGSATCQLFAREGAKVAIVDRNGKAAAALAERIRAAGGQAIGIEANVTDPDSARAAVAAALKKFKRLHVLVNGAGVRPAVRGNAVELPLSEWNRAFDIIVNGAFLMCKNAIPHLKKVKGAAIINICSQQAYVGTYRRSANNAAKAALMHFTRVLALDLAQDRIRVNSLSPGGTLTAHMASLYGSAAEAERRMGDLYPTGRLGRPEEMAAGLLFLASEESRFMNAADLLMDGGYVAFKGTNSMD